MTHALLPVEAGSPEPGFYLNLPHLSFSNMIITCPVNSAFSVFSYLSLAVLMTLLYLAFWEIYIHF